MKKISKDLGKTFRPIVLYREDLLEIHAVFTELSSEVKITCGEWQLDGLSELLTWERGPISELRFRVSEPYVNLDLSPNNIWLYAGNETPAQRGIFEKLSSILTPRQIPLSMPGATLIGLFCIVTGEIVMFTPPMRAYLGWLLLAIGNAVTWGAWWLYFKHRARIRITPRYEPRGFWLRNRDEIIRALIAALFGSMLTLLIPWLWKLWHGAAR